MQFLTMTRRTYHVMLIFLLLHVGLFPQAGGKKDKSFIKVSKGTYNLTLFGKILSGSQRPLPGVSVTVYEATGNVGQRRTNMIPQHDLALTKKGEIKTGSDGNVTIAVDFNKEYVLMFSRHSFYQSTVLVNTYVPRVEGMATYYFYSSLKYYQQNKIGKDSGNVEKLVFFDTRKKKFSILQKGGTDTILSKPAVPVKKIKIPATVPVADTFKTAKIQDQVIVTNRSKPVSKGVVLDEKGTSAEILYNDTVNRIDISSQKQGKWMYFASPDSSRIYSGNYENDRKSGVWNKYFPNDSIEMQLFYKNNVPTGDYRMFYNSGKLKSKGVWNSSVKSFNGKFELYHPNGQPFKNFQYDESGEKSGTQLLYYPSGKMAMVSQMDKGKLSGQTMIFLEDGTAYSERMYTNGSLLSEKKFNPAAILPEGVEEQLFSGLGSPDSTIIGQMTASLGELDGVESNFKSVLKERTEKLRRANKIINDQMKALLINQQKLTKAELENKLKTERLYRQNILGVFGTLLTVALLVIVVITVRNSRHKQKVNVLLNQQKNEIVIKNKEITDSIHYAKRIQQAFLPGQRNLTALLPDSFVLYKPKDIVSGDFYWAGRVSENPDEIIVIVADSTGHGVPGAFMSIVGASLLNQVIIEKNIHKPGLILGELNRGIRHLLQQSQGENRDGIDMALCKITLDRQHEKYFVEYSGAMRPLYIFNGSIFIELPPNKMPIAGYTEENYRFSTHTQVIEMGSAVYLFSDGYADQFGGAEGSKFMTKNFKQLLSSIQHEKMTRQAEMLEEKFNEWKGSLAQLDDVCVIGFRPQPHPLRQAQGNA